MSSTFSGVVVDSVVSVHFWMKLFCGIYSVFKCSFDEFVGEKVVSLSYSSAILGPPLMPFIFIHCFIHQPCEENYIAHYSIIGHFLREGRITTDQYFMVEVSNVFNTMQLYSQYSAESTRKNFWRQIFLNTENAWISRNI